MEFHFRNDIMPEVPTFCSPNDSVYIYHDDEFIANMHNYLLLCEEGYDLGKPVIKTENGDFGEAESTLIRVFERKLVFGHIKVEKVDFSESGDDAENDV